MPRRLISCGAQKIGIINADIYEINVIVYFHCNKIFCTTLLLTCHVVKIWKTKKSRRRSCFPLHASAWKLNWMIFVQTLVRYEFPSKSSCQHHATILKFSYNVRTVNWGLKQSPDRRPCTCKILQLYWKAVRYETICQFKSNFASFKLIFTIKYNLMWHLILILDDRANNRLFLIRKHFKRYTLLFGHMSHTLLITVLKAFVGMKY